MFEKEDAAIAQIRELDEEERRWERERMYDWNNQAEFTDEYEEYFQTTDEHISARGTGEIEISQDMKRIIEFHLGPKWYLSGRPGFSGMGYSQTYLQKEKAYCQLVKRKLENIMGAKGQKVWRLRYANHHTDIPEQFLPDADILHFHDAIFTENEPVTNPEIRPPVKPQRNWWELAAIMEELGEAPGPLADAEQRNNGWTGI